MLNWDVAKKKLCVTSGLHPVAKVCLGNLRIVKSKYRGKVGSEQRLDISFDIDVRKAINRKF